MGTMLCRRFQKPNYPSDNGKRSPEERENLWLGDFALQGMKGRALGGGASVKALYGEFLCDRAEPPARPSD